MRLLRSVVAACLLVCVWATSAAGHPHVPPMGPAIDPPAGYVPQSKCEPAPKPGVVAFLRRMERAYPVSGSLGISRACNIGSTSEHKEGRAVDWAVKYSVPAQRRAANNAITWLLETDRYGNRFAMARRFGIMYLIWHRRIWEPWAGWKTYCVQKGSVCVSPTSGSVLNPHVNHVHFSFTWPGAWKDTTVWHPGYSFVSSIASTPWGGYWLSGRNGQVMPYNSPWFGDLSARVPKARVVAVAPTPDGQGYWLLNSKGAIKAYGDAANKGSRRKDPIHAGGFASTPKGGGYWIFSRRGRVYAYGKAAGYGGLAHRSGTRVVSLLPTTTGHGYWLVTAGGRVHPFGDARRHGRARHLSSPVVGADAHFDDGYWLVTARGRVLAFGGAHSYGGVARKHLRSPVVGLTATASGDGYWLATSRGRVFPFGDAQNYGYPGRSVRAPVTHHLYCGAGCSGPDGLDLRD